ncbi:MAG: ribonuclease III [Candidatus Harrisonbacteria bacterium CG10_big_fil_rev_8_21_14_0_10_44_23]|uniref:Ribonuclease 3 n=1 Tax=Candidatus Harrisonbacteria bacterium CG10_big_fil_rev_8_21_14_0_10_44_23 TaxID=1974585 RepID=A0A2H0UPV1_9BACT|nr:MAG: ribonuclease III [Candidatus Harrisonbacteria bacterium CG10_big_fil_rev_8_21_14_0_10_44_23]
MKAGDLEKQIGYKFKKKVYLEEATTHRSFLNENPRSKDKHNERLEFLGDAVLELAVTEELFNRFPTKPEGDLTAIRAALVNTVSLAEVGRELELDSYLRMSKGEAKDTGKAREAILANGVEALIGGVYLDGGFEKAKKLVNKLVLVKLDNVIATKSYIDAKSSLQEKVQAKFKITPNYRVITESGPDHQKDFVVGVYFADKLAAEGSGPSKHDAEVEAAEKALKEFE